MIEVMRNRIDIRLIEVIYIQPPYYKMLSINHKYTAHNWVNNVKESKRLQKSTLQDI